MARCSANEHLKEMLAMARITPMPAYKPCQVQRILNIGAATFTRLCDNFDPNQERGIVGLQSFFISGHRRVRHNAIVEMMDTNDNYNQQMEL